MTTLENLNETTKELQKEYEEVLSNKFNNNTIDMLDSVTTVMFDFRNNFTNFFYNLSYLLSYDTQTLPSIHF